MERLEHKVIPQATSYEINERGAVRNIKHKSPVFENQLDEMWLTSNSGKKIMVDTKQLVKELFGIELKNTPLNKFQKEQLKQSQTTDQMKKTEKKPKQPKTPKVVKEKKVKEPKAPKENAVSTVNKSIKEGDEITFSPRWKKQRAEGQESVKGIITKIFIGADKNEYAKIKAGEKTYLKQTKSL